MHSILVICLVVCVVLDQMPFDSPSTLSTPNMSGSSSEVIQFFNVSNRLVKQLLLDTKPC